MIQKEYIDYAQDILDSINDVAEFTKRISFDDFIHDKKTVNAVIRSIEIIGEAAKNIPEPIRKKYPNIPWKKMAGMRDKLIHEYSGVDLETIWKTAMEDLPLLKPLITLLLENIEAVPAKGGQAKGA